MLSSEQIEALESLPEAGRCRRCNGWLEDAHSIPCGHDFCGECIKEALAEENVCPECNLPTWSSAPLRNYQLNNCVAAARKLMEIGNKLRKIEHPAGSYNELMTAGNDEQEDNTTLEDIENMFKMCSDSENQINEKRDEPGSETPSSTGDTTVMQHGSPWDTPMLPSAHSTSSSRTTVLQTHNTTWESEQSENAEEEEEDNGTSFSNSFHDTKTTLHDHETAQVGVASSGTSCRNDSAVVQRDTRDNNDVAMHEYNVNQAEQGFQCTSSGVRRDITAQTGKASSLQKQEALGGVQVSIVGTGLSEEEQRKLERLKDMLNAELGASCSVSVTKEFLPHITTHVVTKLEDSSAKSRRCLRTVKYLLGVATGAWIVSMEWVNQCLETTCKLDEKMFEISEDTCARHGAISSRKAAQEGKDPLFNSYMFYIHGRLGPLPLKDAQNIIEAAGGYTEKFHTALRGQSSILSTENERKVLVLAHAASLSGKSKAKLKETAKAPVVDISWVLECISYFQIRPIRPHLIEL